MILGIDTSCYTTSMVTLSIESGSPTYEKNQNLTVKPGERGLRQSEGFFQHVHKLAETFDDLVKHVSPGQIKAIAVSSRPRPQDQSYMPVFQAGLLFANNLANALGVPLYRYSHQEGHLMAAIYSAKISNIPKQFYGLHISGGTTELLYVSAIEDGFSVDCIGGTLDLNFGQLIDRIGVKLGFSFPCGKEMDLMAQSENHKDFFKVKLKDSEHFNISGLENKYLTLIETNSASYCCRHIFNTIGWLLSQLIEPLNHKEIVVFSGGVASNSIVRAIIENNFKNRKVYFAMPEYARDNALGIAELGRLQYIGERNV